MRNYLSILLFLIALSAGFAGPMATQAEGTDDAQWGIVPVPALDPTITDKGYFVYPMQADALVSGQVLLRNPGTTPVTIDLTAVTAETAQTGGSAFAVESGVAGGVAGWIDLSEKQATIDPGTERPINFTFKTPADVKPGQYLAGISASEAPAATDTDSGTKAGLGAAITIKKRYIIGVQADIAGTWTPSLLIPNVSVLDQPSGTVLGIALSNDGDTFLTPTGSVVLTDAADKQLLSQDIDMGTFVPGTAITYPVSWPGKPAAGTYGVAVTLEYADGKTVTYNDTIVVSSDVAQHAVEMANANSAVTETVVQPVASAIQPWMLAVVGGFLLLVIILLVLNLLRSRSKRAAA